MNIDESAGRVRASDAEREQYARIVREATGEGRLTLDEGDERLASVYATRFRDELPRLVADLPAGQPSPPGGPGTDVRRRPGYGRRVDYWPYRGFLLAFGTMLVVTAFLVGVWALWGGHFFFWPAIPLIFFSLALLRRARWHR